MEVLEWITTALLVLAMVGIGGMKLVGNEEGIKQAVRLLLTHSANVSRPGSPSSSLSPSDGRHDAMNATVSCARSRPLERSGAASTRPIPRSPTAP